MRSTSGWVEPPSMVNKPWPVGISHLRHLPERVELILPSFVSCVLSVRTPTRSTFRRGLVTRSTCRAGNESLYMNTSVGEYDPSDTPSGFLRWSRPASDEPSRVRRLSRGLKATTKRYPAHHLVTWALLLGLPLALLLWYIWTFRTIAYRLPWVLEISIESMAMEEHVWCGMISLYPGLQYCARGTIDLRVRNRLWVDLTVVGADVELDALLVTISQINHRFDGSVTIGGPIDVNAMSESVFPSPAVLLAHPYTRNSACKVSDHSIKVELHALGYYFGSWIYVGGVQFPPNHHQDEPANTLSNHEVVETTPTAIGNDLHWR